MTSTPLSFKKSEHVSKDTCDYRKQHLWLTVYLEVKTPSKHVTYCANLYNNLVWSPICINAPVRSASPDLCLQTYISKRSSEVKIAFYVKWATLWMLADFWMIAACTCLSFLTLDSWLTTCEALCAFFSKQVWPQHDYALTKCILRACITQGCGGRSISRFANRAFLI